MTYSTDFRRRVSELKERDGLSIEETAVRFGVGQAGVFRWSKRLEPYRNRNKPSVKIDTDRLVRDVEEHPDGYQHERAERLGCSQRGISDALKRLGISRKKTFQHPKADENARNAFISRIKAYQADEKHLVYIDESGFAQDMPRVYGYAPAGKRCFGRHDWNTKGRINVIGALLNNQLLTVSLVNGSIDADVFYVY